MRTTEKKMDKTYKKYKINLKGLLEVSYKLGAK